MSFDSLKLKPARKKSCGSGVPAKSVPSGRKLNLTSIFALWLAGIEKPLILMHLTAPSAGIVELKAVAVAEQSPEVLYWMLTLMSSVLSSGWTWIAPFEFLSTKTGSPRIEQSVVGVPALIGEAPQFDGIAGTVRIAVARFWFAASMATPVLL